jgi:hypothetical protein
MTLPLEARKNLDHQLTPILDTEASEKPTQVRAHRRHRYVEFMRDLLVGMAQKQLLDDFGLARR